jgi:hypothetical protein
MKNKIKSVLLFVVVGLLITSCAKDNYKAPSATFKGALLYNGVDTVFVQQSTGHDINAAKVYFYLYEPGWQKTYTTPIRVAVDAGGTFSSMLFPATYKLVMPLNNGPFIPKPDTTVVNVTGNQTLNIPVTPYYLVRNLATSLSTSDSTVTASFKIDKIVTDANAKTIGTAQLYISRTIIVDGSNYIANSSLTAAAITDLSNVVLKAKIPNLNKIVGLGISTTQKQFFVRVGVRINGSTEVFSTVKAVNLP